MSKLMVLFFIFGLIALSTANSILSSAELTEKQIKKSNSNSELIDEEIEELLAKLRVYMTQKEIDSLIPSEDFYEAKREILKRPFNPQTRWGKRGARFNPQTRWG